MNLINPYFDLHQSLEGLSDERKLAIRKKLIWVYSWAIPNLEAIEALRGLGPLVELGTGTGYWAWLLSQAGADVVAYDRNPNQRPQWVEVREGDASVAQNHSERALLLCWPPLDESLAYEAAVAHRGNTLVYIGEMQGRTGDFRFHELLSREFRLIKKIVIPNWPTYRDNLHIFQRRTEN